MRQEAITTIFYSLGSELAIAATILKRIKGAITKQTI